MEYTYRILKSSIEHNLMEVEFSSVGHDTLVVGMPLPVEGQDYLDIIRSYAPVHYWVRSKQAIIDVPVGETATITDTVLLPLGGIDTTGIDGAVPEDVLMREDLRRNELKALIQSVIAEMSESIV